MHSNLRSIFRMVQYDGSYTSGLSALFCIPPCSSSKPQKHLNILKCQRYFKPRQKRSFWTDLFIWASWSRFNVYASCWRILVKFCFLSFSAGEHYIRCVGLFFIKQHPKDSQKITTLHHPIGPSIGHTIGFQLVIQLVTQLVISADVQQHWNKGCFRWNTRLLNSFTDPWETPYLWSFDQLSISGSCPITKWS